MGGARPRRIVNIIGNGGKVASPDASRRRRRQRGAHARHRRRWRAYAAKGVRVVGLNPGLTKTGRVAEGMKPEAKRTGISEKGAQA